MDYWISEEVFSWSSATTGGSILEKDKIRRSYELLTRAERFLGESPPSEDDLSDCIGSLRKCLTHRNRFFEDSYNIRQALEVGKKRHYLEVLADLKVVRPTLLKGLLDIRNEIEYNDSPPPPVEECAKLVDIVWYFLRSTDTLLSVQRNDIELNLLDEDGEESPYMCELRISYTPEFKVRLSGWVTPDLISSSAKSDHIFLDAEISHAREEQWGNQYHTDKNPDDVWVAGLLNPDLGQRRQIIELALSADW